MHTTTAAAVPPNAHTAHHAPTDVILERRMTRALHFDAFVMNTNSHIHHGQPR